MFTKQFERRVYVAAAVFALSVLIGSSLGVFALWPSRREQGYEPDQPIRFSHALHAGDLKINCLYCHSRAERGPQATVPPVSTCMNCHTEVQTRDPEGRVKPEIAKLVEVWNRKEPIIWNKVNDLADFAYFDHSRHLAAGRTCQECHGPVESMQRIRREYGQKMSWCLDCHRQPLPEGHPARLQGRTTLAPIHCSACHR